MKKYCFILLLLAASFFVKAQLNYFMYLQTDNKQAFYVKMNDKLLSSSSAGYLIIPKLPNGDYNIVIGFPKEQWPQYTFSINILNNDVGYQIKNFGEKGWGLFNMQSLEITMANNKLPIKKVEESDAAFAAAVSGKETPKPIENKPEQIIVPSKEVVTTPVVTKKTSYIEKLNDTTTTKAYTAQYLSHENDNTDTITLEISMGKKKNYGKPSIVQPKEKKMDEVVDTNTTKETIAKKGKFLDIELQNPNTKPVVEKSIKKEETIIPTAAVANLDTLKNTESKVIETNPKIFPKEVVKKADDIAVIGSNKEQFVEPNTINYVNKNKPIVPFNSDCKNTATEDDFKKIRKKMAAENTDNDMIVVANKYFKGKCFSVEQVKNLSLLFLNDKGKYSFFDEAYPYTIDTKNFVTLQSQLHEVYYINRFKAMIGY